MGSLVAALASYLDARQSNGRWLLRIEDLDPPRESLTAPSEIKRQLEAHGLHWDSELFQSQQLDVYEAVLEQLRNQGNLFNCDCTRKQTPPIYPGTCRERTDVSEPFAIRFRVKDVGLSIQDRHFGTVSWQLRNEVGDFIIRRKDGLFAYQLAVVVDDEQQGITHVVRGSDLLDSTPRQIALIDALGYPMPTYLHIPVLVDQHGDKLSKQAHAPPIDSSVARKNLLTALKLLGQDVAAEMARDTDTIEELLETAIYQWSETSLPAGMAIEAIKGNDRRFPS